MDVGLRPALACAMVGLVAFAAAAGAGPARPAAGPPAGAAPRDPEALVSALGCGACHAGVPGPLEARRAAPGLGAGGRPWRPDSLLAYLLSPTASGTAPSAIARMPAFHLSEGEALALTLFLETTLPEAPESGRDRVEELRGAYPDVGPGTGRSLYLALDCAGCHAGADVAAWKSGPDLSGEGSRARRGWLTSWLAHPVALRPSGFFPGTGTRMPDFGLSGAELEALVAYLTDGDGATRLPRPPDADPLSAFRRTEAARLLRTRSACLGCHALDGEGGRIGPELAGLGVRRPDAYVWAMIRDPRGTRPRSVMPRSPEAPARDTLLYRLLLTGGGPGGRPGSATGGPSVRGHRDAGGAAAVRGTGSARDGYVDLVANPPLPPDGWMLRGEPRPGSAGERYRHLCAPCHGRAGGGDGFNASRLPVPPARHADSAAMSARTDARLFDAVYGGGRVLGRSPRMPAFGRSLDRDAIWGLVGHVRRLCGCRSPSWYRDNGESGVPGSAARTPAGASSGGPRADTSASRDGGR